MTCRKARFSGKSLRGKGDVVLSDKKRLREHQKDALEAVRTGLCEADRGKMIMACGTGKTLTSLRIAEDLTGMGKHVLVLMPSLALMAQSVREWTADAEVPLRSFAVCSDTQVGKRRKRDADVAEIDILDLAFPATTDPGSWERACAALPRQDDRRVCDLPIHPGRGECSGWIRRPGI